MQYDACILQLGMHGKGALLLTFQWGRATATTIPGKPAPVPFEATIYDACQMIQTLFTCLLIVNMFTLTNS
jgi:hypothetical protein